MIAGIAGIDAGYVFLFLPLHEDHGNVEAVSQP